MRTVAADGNLITGIFRLDNVGSCAVRWKRRAVAAPIVLTPCGIRRLRGLIRQALATLCAPPYREGRGSVRRMSAV
jgi:hypothetical protein